MVPWAQVAKVPSVRGHLKSAKSGLVLSCLVLSSSAHSHACSDLCAFWLRSRPLRQGTSSVTAVAALFRSRGLLVPFISDGVGAMPPLVPISAPISGNGRWQPASVVLDRVSVTGGYNTRGEGGIGIEYQVDGTTHVFVELNKYAPWFVKGVGGARLRKTDLKPIQVMELLRDKYDDAGKGQFSAVAGSQSDSQEPVNEEVDPMHDMDDLVETVAVTKRNRKPRSDPTPQRQGRSSIEQFEVPTRPPCAAGDTDDKTLVCVYKKARTDNRSRVNLYLRADCIDWLLAYAADELHFQGVAQPTPEPIDDNAPNCPAVADLHLNWNFNAKAWTAKFVAGALKGTTKQMFIRDLDRDVWDKLKSQSLVEDCWSAATAPQKKSGLKELMVMWCVATARGDPAAFEATMGSPNSKLRGEKRGLEDALGEAEQCCPESVSDDTAVAALFMDDGDEVDGLTMDDDGAFTDDDGAMLG